MYMYLFNLVPPLIGTILRLLQIHTESKPDDGGEDEQLQTLSEIMAEFLSDICLLISKVFLTTQLRDVSAVMVWTTVVQDFRTSLAAFCSICTFFKM